MDNYHSGDREKTASLVLIAGLIVAFLLVVIWIFGFLTRQEDGGKPGRTAVQNLQDGDGRLAFVAVLDRYPALYTIDAGGSVLAQLSDEMGFISAPVWSPDGTRLAFWAVQDVNIERGQADIYIVNADGSGLTNLTRSPVEENSPAWSPDGSQIAYNSLKTGKEELYVMNADGMGSRQLTNDPQTAVREPRWSPDGGSIAFTCAQGTESSLCLIQPDGSGLARLKEGETPTWLAESSVFPPKGRLLSPDGRVIVYFEDGTLYRMNADGTQITRIMDGVQPDSFSWQPTQ